MKSIRDSESGRTTSAAVGVVGLGIMGGAMARSLAQSGWRVFGFDIDSGRKSTATSVGVEVAANLPELLEKTEVIITSLPSAAAVHSTVVAIANAGGKKIVVEASTLSLDDKLKLKTALDAAGHIALDCPISGTGAQALTKDLVVYASGNPQVIAELRPLFLCFARQVFDLGEFGNGTRMKLVANLLVAIHNVATAEAMVMANKAGLSLGQVVESLSAGAGTSRVFEQRAPLMAKAQYEPASMKLSVWQKDLTIISEFAKNLDSPVPLLNATLQIYAAAAANGGNRDTAAVFTVLEQMGN
jgi:putative dehydrogenase